MQTTNGTDRQTAHPAIPTQDKHGMGPDTGPIKAEELIAALQRGGWKGHVVDEGDARPCYDHTEVKIARDGRCSIVGHARYREDSREYTVDWGYAEAEILGVVFYKPFLDQGEWSEPDETSRPIEYDGELCENEVIDAADNAIEWPEYKLADYPLEPDQVTMKQILAGMEFPEGVSVFAKDKAGGVFAYGKGHAVPDGLEPVSRDEALAILALERPGFAIAVHGRHPCARYWDAIRRTVGRKKRKHMPPPIPDTIGKVFIRGRKATVRYYSNHLLEGSDRRRLLTVECDDETVKVAIRKAWKRELEIDEREIKSGRRNHHVTIESVLLGMLARLADNGRLRVIRYPIFHMYGILF